MIYRMLLETNLILKKLTEMKDIDKKVKKKLSVRRRDLWDKYWMSYWSWKEWKKREK